MEGSECCKFSSTHICEVVQESPLPNPRHIVRKQPRPKAKIEIGIHLFEDAARLAVRTGWILCKNLAGIAVEAVVQPSAICSDRVWPPGFASDNRTSKN